MCQCSTDKAHNVTKITGYQQKSSLFLVSSLFQRSELWGFAMNCFASSFYFYLVQDLA